MRRHQGNGFEVPPSISKLLNKLTVTQIAQLSGLSKSYVSHVKHGRRPPSPRLIQALLPADSKSYEAGKAIDLFLDSRREGLSPRTINDFYKQYLTRAVPVLGLTPTPAKINAFLRSLTCSEGGKHAYFRALRVFYRWLYSPKSGFGFEERDNPIKWVSPPKVPKLILPSLSREEVQLLLGAASSPRDRAMIALFTESGLRLSELTRVKPQDIDWHNRLIKTVGKGNKEGYAPFGPLTQQYLREWLGQQAAGTGPGAGTGAGAGRNNIWHLTKWGVIKVLVDLRRKTGLRFSAHTFRRTFACLLRKAGVDSMTIKDLGRWESLEMVQRYTRSVEFRDALRFYRAPLSAGTGAGEGYPTFEATEYLRDKSLLVKEE
jgi:integrase/recombinase XerC